jgi:DNA adenine methylase
MRFPSPLRYPGGKNKLAKFVSDIVIRNDIQGGTYVEPFAGGASIALHLLFRELVSMIIINDMDRSIFSFWHAVLNYTDRLCNMILDTPVNMEEWEKQKQIQNDKHHVGELELAFSTFFLNRTNRSGIINGGVIGGKTQSGKWKMDARYNKGDLVRRIQKIALYRNRILLYNKDAIDFAVEIEEILDENSLIYFDPPYYNKGSALYINHYTHEDHVTLSHFIQSLECKWILTYDYTPCIIEMYRQVQKRRLTLSYTAAKKVQGVEMLAFSDNVVLPTGKYGSITVQ